MEGRRAASTCAAILALLAVSVGGAVVACKGSLSGSGATSGLVTGESRRAFEANVGQTDAAVRFLTRVPGGVLFVTRTGITLKLEGSQPRNGRPTGPAVARVVFAGAAPSTEVEGIDPRPTRVSYFVGNQAEKWRSNVPVFSGVKYAGIYPGVNLLVAAGEKSLSLRLVAAPDARTEALQPRLEEDAFGALDGAGGVVVSDRNGASFVFERPRLYQDGREVVSGLEWRLALATEANNSLASSEDPSASPSATPTPVPVPNVINNPQLVYSTFLGGTGMGTKPRAIVPFGDMAFGVAVDQRSRIYVTGYTTSLDFPISSGALQNSDKGASNGDPNVFVSVIDPSLPPDAQLVYSTYLGGSGCPAGSDLCPNGDIGWAIAVGEQGYIYVTGYTFSPDFPVTANALQKSNRCFGRDPSNNFGPANAFLTVINPNAGGDKQLVYSTYLGGTGGELGDGLAVDSQGHAYVAGMSDSIDFPVTASGFERVNRASSSNPGNVNPNGFLSILDPSKSGANSMLYSTYLGGSQGDIVDAVALGPKGLVYLTGEAVSQDFPITPSAFKPKIGSVPAGHPADFVVDSFFTVLDPSKLGPLQLVYSTYLGGTNEDIGNAVAVDGNGFGYVGGQTCISGLELTDDFPTTLGAFQTTYPKDPNTECVAFMSKLNPKAAGRASLVYSTYLAAPQAPPGPSGVAQQYTKARGIGVDSSGLVYLGGVTNTTAFPITPGALQPTQGGINNCFISIIDPRAHGAADLAYSTYLGGDAGDEPETGGGFALGPGNLVYIAGEANSMDFPVTSNAFEERRPSRLLRNPFR